STSKNIHNRLFIYQSFIVTEIVELEVKNINLDKAEIFIKGSIEITSKSPKSRTLPLQAKQILLFYKYLEKDRTYLLKYNFKNPDETAFILGQYGEKINPHGISRIINENRKESDKIQPMKIRQSVIANLPKKENDTRIVQVLSGHKRARTTVKYKQSELEQLQNAVNNYHPIR